MGTCIVLRKFCRKNFPMLGWYDIGMMIIRANTYGIFYIDCLISLTKSVR